MRVVVHNAIQIVIELADVTVDNFGKVLRCHFVVQLKKIYGPKCLETLLKLSTVTAASSMTIPITTGILLLINGVYTCTCYINSVHGCQIHLCAKIKHVDMGVSVQYKLRPLYMYRSQGGAWNACTLCIPACLAAIVQAFAHLISMKTSFLS